MKTGHEGDLHTLEEELKKLGITVVSGRQDTVISVKIKGLAGRALVRGLRLADQLLQEKIKHALKTFTDADSKLFTDPTFGPSSSDPNGAAAMCKSGELLPSKGGSQHQMKVLGLLKRGKIRWERPRYACDEEEPNDRENESEDDQVEPSNEDEDEDSAYAMASVADRPFASDATLFADGVCSGDVIQGNLGDCWFLSALSVVATRSDLLEQAFWRGDQYKSKGLFVCKFMKNFVWNYVVIDDRFPVFGFSDSKPGKPYFARCRNPNELWVSLLEKAYAKLHGSYEMLIGGFVDVALNDLTGMCSEQVILKSGFPGYGEDPYAAVKPGQQNGDPFWEKLTRYKSSGTLMGCSIQPPPTSTAGVAVESSAGNGLYFKHAYALVDVGEIQTAKGETVRLVKLRNPWGMGEWTGPWSDSSDERSENEDVIEKYFKIIKRHIGINAERRVFMSVSSHGTVSAEEIAQEDVVDVNSNDGTFFMAFDAWMQSFTHFFAGIDFPDSWHGRRTEGRWNESNCGGNTTKSTWVNNPHFELVLEERARIFASLSQEDPRGTTNLKLVPVGFHICSLSAVEESTNKFEIREPAGKPDAYYRLYKPEDRAMFQSGQRPEKLPPAVIPGSVIAGVDDDGVPQPAYTFKQAVSVDATMEPGRYCIIPSMYMRTDKATGATNVGSFWISVYSDKPCFRLEGGEKIVEEEEGEDEVQALGPNTRRSSVANEPPMGKSPSTSSLSKKSDTIVTTGSTLAAEKRRAYEDAKEDFLRQAKSCGIGLRELKLEFSKTATMHNADCRRKLQVLGFKADGSYDDKLGLLFGGTEEGVSNGIVFTSKILSLFDSDIREEQMACDVPVLDEDDETPEPLHREGVLEIELHGATGLALGQQRQPLVHRKVRFPAIEFTGSEQTRRRRIASQILEQNSPLAAQLHRFAQVSGLLVAGKRQSPEQTRDIPSLQLGQLQTSSPVETFFKLLDADYAATLHNDPIDAQEMGERVLPPRRASTSLRRDSMPPFFSAPSPHGVSTVFPMYTIPSNAIELHKSERLRELENKRSMKFASLLQHKQQALGDTEKTAALPRLIGGRKSGSSHVQCTDCGARVLFTGRGNRQNNTRDTSTSNSDSFACNGSNCVNTFCRTCYLLLPKRSKLCEQCFLHECLPSETFGEQLRAILIEKIGASDDQRARLEEVFRSFDADSSGTLTAQEFERVFELLQIQPTLSRGQKQFLLDQFDVNGDGEVSLAEFGDWILKDRVWEEQLTLGTTREASEETAAEVLDTIISPLCDEIVNLAYETFGFSCSMGSWVHSTSSTAVSNVQPGSSKGAETGAVIFQRVVSLEVSSEEYDVHSSTAERIFEQFDDDGSGQMEQSEFTEFLAVLGLHLPLEDVKLLMSRLEPSVGTFDSDAIARQSFVSYVEKMASKVPSRGGMPSKPCYLSDVLIRLDAVAESSPVLREVLQDQLQQLHENIRKTDLLIMCKALETKAEVHLEVGELERLSYALMLHDDVVITKPTGPGENSSQQPEFKSSGDILSELLLSTSSDVMHRVKRFDLQRVCEQLAVHLETRTGTNDVTSMWHSLFGVSTLESIAQSDFVVRVLQEGFTVNSSDDAIEHMELNRGLQLTQLLLALMLDAVRVDCGWLSDNYHHRGNSRTVTFKLFTVIVRERKLNEIERRFDHALARFMQLSRGEQWHLVTVSLDRNKTLVIRARDPIFKFAADFIVHEDEFDIQNLAAHLSSSELTRRLQDTHDGSREQAFTRSPHGLITALCLPEVDSAILAVLARLRVVYRRRHGSVSLLSQQRPSSLHLCLVENGTFVSTLRNLLSQIETPFFWSVSPSVLEFSVDGEYLAQLSKPSFQQLVAETFSQYGSSPSSSLRALVAFVSHTASSLRVRYAVVGKHASVETRWEEFQDFISGHQDTYAILALYPQGKIFSTRVARTSGTGTTQWNFKTQIVIEEPEECDRRIDRPVVFTDTVQASRAPGNAQEGKKIGFILDDPTKEQGHFVVLSVRRALPVGRNVGNARLYCTAYDPLTACDFAVEGYPDDWAVDFFDVSVNPAFESQWHAMLETMTLGETLTPKLSVSVFNKQRKTDSLIGECEISVGSAITAEGHIFEEQVSLESALSTSSTAGMVNVAFRFDVKKARKAAAGDVSTSSSSRKRERRPTGTSVPISMGAEYLAGEIVTPRVETTEDDNEKDNKLRELQDSVAAMAQAKREAHEQVQRLKVQVQQLLHTSTITADEAASRWRRRLEQERQEQLAAQEASAKRLLALQEEVQQLLQENEKHKLIPRVVSNLNEAGLEAEASAHDILAAMKGILLARCPERPYNGLKKALAAVAEVPGKVAFAMLDDVLGDFGLAVSADHRKTLSSIFDPKMCGRVSIEDFFLKLCGDAEAYATVADPTPSEPISLVDVEVQEAPAEPVAIAPSPPAQRPVSPATSPVRAAVTLKPKMTWQDMKKFLVLNLPEGWETRFTEKGRPYFCCHASRSTQWKHPKPEIETIFSEWVQENGAYFNRMRATTAHAARNKR